DEYFAQIPAPLHSLTLDLRTYLRKAPWFRDWVKFDASITASTSHSCEDEEAKIDTNEAGAKERIIHHNNEVLEKTSHRDRAQALVALQTFSSKEAAFTTDDAVNIRHASSARASLGSSSELSTVSIVGEADFPTPTGLSDVLEVELSIVQLEEG
ncbi:unnamed protein product, partial [Amoebophrya sp. A25]